MICKVERNVILIFAVRDTDPPGASAVGEDENIREDPREQGTSGIADIIVSHQGGRWRTASVACH